VSEKSDKGAVLGAIRYSISLMTEEAPIEFLTASPPMGLLLIKPAEMMLFYTGADSLTYRSDGKPAQRYGRE